MSTAIKSHVTLLLIPVAGDVVLFSMNDAYSSRNCGRMNLLLIPTAGDVIFFSMSDAEYAKHYRRYIRWVEGPSVAEVARWSRIEVAPIKLYKNPWRQRLIDELLASDPYGIEPRVIYRLPRFDPTPATIWGFALVPEHRGLYSRVMQQIKTSVI